MLMGIDIIDVTEYKDSMDLCERIFGNGGCSPEYKSRIEEYQQWAIYNVSVIFSTDAEREDFKRWIIDNCKGRVEKYKGYWFDEDLDVQFLKMVWMRKNED